MRAHIVANGVITNTIEVESLAFMPGLVASVGNEGIGWSYVGGVFIEPAPIQPTIEELKAERAALVAAIVVTTTAGNSFDGNEDAQNRMSRSINGMNDGESIGWVLADNSIISASKAELREALRLSGAAMTAIWMAPYQ